MSAPHAPTQATVHPARPAAPQGPEPYRVLFPAGALLGVAGVMPWVIQAASQSGWPVLPHARLMLQGFESAFIVGFLLTAAPALTHGARVSPRELAACVGAWAVGALAAMLDRAVLAPACGALTLLLTMLVLRRRVRGGAAAPPVELLLVAGGLLTGAAGMAWQALAAAGYAAEPVPRFAVRLVSFGMVLPIVLGLGGRLVPTFAMMPTPLTILGVGDHRATGPRLAFVLALAALLAAALVAEARDAAALGAWLRAAAAVASGMLAWKLWQLPGRIDRLPLTIWSAGWALVLGTLWAALDPTHRAAAWHLVFVGGYGLLTLGIATRVVVGHGGHPHTDERRILAPLTLLSAIIALAARITADLHPSGPWLPIAAIAWIGTWSLWLSRIIPRLKAPTPRTYHPSNT